MKNSYRRYLLATAAAVVIGAGLTFNQAIVAVAQSISIPLVTDITTADDFPVLKNGTPTAQSTWATLARMRAAMLSGGGAHTGTPVLTGCVTSGGTISGTDAAFLLTQGSSANTSCVATFSTAFNLAPICSVQPQTLSIFTAGVSFVVTTISITITQASLSSTVYDVVCVGRPGG